MKSDTPDSLLSKPDQKRSPTSLYTFFHSSTEHSYSMFVQLLSHVSTHLLVQTSGLFVFNAKHSEFKMQGKGFIE